MCVSTHLYLYKHVSNDMDICFLKEEKNINILKITYMSIYLNKMKHMIKQFEDSIIQKKSDNIMDEETFF